MLFLIDTFEKAFTNPDHMLRNHLIFSIRLFLKDRGYSVLNIFGLALGISIGIILLLYLQGELTYDQHYAKHKQIYRYTNHLIADGADFNNATTARELAPILKSDLPEVLEYVRFNKFYNTLIEFKGQSGLKQFYSDKVWQVDSTFFSVFDHTFLEGNPQSCLSGPDKVVITKAMSDKFFGDQTALGRILEFPDNDKREVTAVISNLPDNTHLKYHFLLSNIEPRPWFARQEEKGRSEAFWNTDVYTYLLLPPNYNTNDFIDKFPSIFDKTFKLFGKRINGRVIPNLQPISEVHYHADYDDDAPTGNLVYLYTFLAVGLFVILLACINYMNMATARAVMRTREMAVRKVLGFSKGSLFQSVLFEAIFLAFIAMVIAVLFSFLILEFTPFNTLIDKNLTLNFLDNPILFFGILGITLLVGVLSGIYPALYIPSVPVVSALKSTFTNSRSEILLRKGLIIFQFVISLFVVMCTYLMDGQIDFVQQKELGFNKENVIIVDIQDTLISKNVSSLKAELFKNPHILSATTAYSTPGVDAGGQVMWVEKDSTLEQQYMNCLYVGAHYLETMGIELKHGRDFFQDSKGEYFHAFLANESAVREFGWEATGLDKRVRFFHDEKDKNDRRIVGVVKDFNFESLHAEVKPLFIILTEREGGRMHIRVDRKELPSTIGYIETIWGQFDDKHPFEYAFLDQRYAEQYDADQIQHKLILILSVICVFVSLLGLVGLSAFSASRRAKEVGIRKVLGASVLSIIIMFSKDYILLILIAFLISIPLANYVMVEWLASFAYQVSISWYYFVVPGIAILVFGLLTVVIQSFRFAQSNPVESLRTE